MSEPMIGSDPMSEEPRRGKRGLLLPIAVAVVGLAAVAALENAPTRHGIEANLTSRSVHALDHAGLAGIRVSFTGRDGTIYAPTRDDGNRALVIVTNLNGVRAARVVIAGTVPVSPTPTSSPSPTPTSSPSPVPTTSPVPIAEVQKQIDAVNHIEFSTGKATLTVSSHAVIAKLATILRANPTVRVRIEGDTDSQGSAASNLTLSKARATSVYQALRALGIAADRMTVIGYGESRPKVPNTSAANRAINRRVDIVVLS